MRHLFPFILISMAFVVSGCDWFEKSVQKDPEKDPDPIEQIKNIIPTTTAKANYVKLSLDGELKTGDCFILFQPPSSNVPGVLEVTNYQEISGQSYPSIYIRAVDVGVELQEILNQTVAAEIRAAKGPGAAFWHSTREEPAEIKIVEVTDDRVVGIVEHARLISTDDGSSVNVTGRFEGKLQKTSGAAGDE